MTGKRVMNRKADHQPLLADHIGTATPNTADEIARTRVTVCGWARDADEALLLLDMLGVR